MEGHRGAATERSAAVSWSSLKACLAMSRDVMKMEPSTVVVFREVFVRIM